VIEMAGYDKERNELGKSYDLAMGCLLNYNQKVLNRLSQPTLTDEAKADLVFLDEVVPRLAKRLYKMKMKALDKLVEEVKQ